MKKTSRLFAIPYALWVFLFVLAPVALIIFKSFFDIHGNFTLANYQTYFNSPNITYLRMSFNSILRRYYYFSHPFGILSDCLFLDQAQASTTLAHVDYLANLGKSFAESLCLYRYFRSTWFH